MTCQPRIRIAASDRERGVRLHALIEAAARGRVLYVEGRDADLVVADGRGPDDDTGDDTFVVDPDAPDAEHAAAHALRMASDRAHLRGTDGEPGRPLDDFFNLPNAAFAFVGRRGTLLRVNHGLATLLEDSPSELAGRAIDALLAPGERPHDLRSFRLRSTASSLVYTGERRYRTRSGSTVAMHLVVTVVNGRDDRPAYYFVQASPVCAQDGSVLAGSDLQTLVAGIRRVQAMAMRGSHPRIIFNELLRHYQKLTGSADAILALTDTETDGRVRMRLVAVQSPHGYLGYDQVGTADGIAVDASCAIIRTAVASAAPCWGDAPGRLWAELEEEFEAENVLVLPLRRGPVTVGLVLLSNASTGYGEELVENLKPFTTTCASILATHVEAERRVRVEEELLESRRTFENLLAHLPGMAYRCEDDDRRTVLFASEGCRELLAIGPDELIGERGGTLIDFVHPADRDAVLDELRWAVLRGRRFELTYRVDGADGVERWAWEQGQGVHSPDGELLFVEGFVTDVTQHRRADEERRRLEARIRRAHKVESLGVLAGGIAHDFNNLLVGVLGNAQLLRDRLGSDADSVAALTEIENAAQRAAELTDHMLSYTGQGEVTLRPVEPAEVLRRTRQVIDRIVPSEARLALEVSDNLPSIMGDAGLLQRAIVELVRNAVESFGGERGGIAIRMEQRDVDAEELAESWLGARLPAGPYVVIDVVDDGPGMDETVRQRAFDPFFTTKGTGRGMGLATVLGAMRAHGGAIHVARGLTRGTHVTLFVPPADEPAVELRPAPAAAPALRSASATILVVDDEKVVREVARRALTRAGYRVQCACDGEDAIAQFEAEGERIDAVLLDLTMPRMSGEETLEELRKRRADLPILLSSGFAEHAVMNRLAGRDGVYFLHKPYRLAELVEKLRAALESVGSPPENASPSPDAPSVAPVQGGLDRAD